MNERFVCEMILERLTVRDDVNDKCQDGSSNIPCFVSDERLWHIEICTKSSRNYLNIYNINPPARHLSSTSISRHGTNEVC